MMLWRCGPARFSPQGPCDDRVGAIAGLLSRLDALLRLGRIATEADRLVAGLRDAAVVRELVRARQV